VRGTTTARQQAARSTLKEQAMHTVARLALIAAMAASTFCCRADEARANCWRDAVEAHVRQQYLVYGPQSIKREYFGFMFVRNGVIGSAITRSPECKAPDQCRLNTAPAARLIPAGAKVLGEWHTHPRGGSASLSMDDVQGAHHNRNISCYIAYYSKPSGEIYAWDPAQTSVPSAMASRLLVAK
jgi:hypothetical protein